MVNVRQMIIFESIQINPLVYQSNYVGSYGGGGRNHDYDVSGSGDTGDVTGSIDATKWKQRHRRNPFTLENGTEVSFEGEWVGKGKIEGTDENGDSYTLEVD